MGVTKRRGVATGMNVERFKKKVNYVHIPQEMLDAYVEEPVQKDFQTAEEREQRRVFNLYLTRCKEKYWGQVGVNIGANILEDILTIAYNDLKAYEAKRKSTT